VVYLIHIILLKSFAASLTAFPLFLNIFQIQSTE